MPRLECGFVSLILMASVISGSTSKGKAKIPISSSSTKGVSSSKGGGGGCDRVPAEGGAGDGVPPGGCAVRGRP
ncbi:hypothetical protein EV2_031609 [Malus domestica]